LTTWAAKLFMRDIIVPSVDFSELRKQRYAFCLLVCGVVSIHAPAWEATVQEAMELTNITSEQELVEIAVRELIQKTRISRIKKFKGNVPFDNIDIDTIRGRNRCLSSFRAHLIKR